MKSVWEILGIEETTDIKAIKKAYAKQVRNCHQEDEPERWQELHEAYKLASDYAKRCNDNNDTLPFTPDAIIGHEDVGEVAESMRAVENQEQISPLEAEPDQYVELFKKLEKEKGNLDKQIGKYFEIFNGVSAVESFEQDNAWKAFFEGDEITTYKKDFMFWYALSLYLGEVDLHPFAFAYLTEKFAELLKEGENAFEENVYHIIYALHRKCWSRSRTFAFFLPQKPVKHPHRVLMILDLLKVIWYLFLLVVLGGAFLVIGFHVLTGQSHKLFGMVWDWICGIF